MVPSLAAESLFPASYVESRARFRKLESFCESHLIPSASDPELTVDVAYSGQDARKLLVLQSGNHGVEGYAGSAVQALFVRDHLAAFRARGIDVLFIHALNPYGFKYNRRVDEENVNLNRNFSAAPGLYQTLNPGYAALRSRLEPNRSIRSSRGANLALSAGLIHDLFTVGRRDLTLGMNSGQYEFPRGLNYGGEKESSQVEILRHVLQKQFRNRDRILFLDWHTGLGRRGHLHLMVSPNSSAKLRAELQPALMTMGESRIELTDVENQVGFYRTTGDIPSFAVALAPEDTSAMAITAEYGTLGSGLFQQMESATRVILENQVHFNGGRNETVTNRIQQNFINLFNPPDPDWRAQVLRLASRVFEQIHSTF